MPEITSNKQRLTIRIGRNSMSFSQVAENEKDVIYEPYVIKSGVSMAANLREAFKTADLLLDPPARVRVVLDSDVLMVPVELFDEKDIDKMYSHTFPKKEQDIVCYNVLPDLNAVAVFAMNKDLRLVIDDHFKDVKVITAISPVWRQSCMAISTRSASTSSVSSKTGLNSATPSRQVVPTIHSISCSMYGNNCVCSPSTTSCIS